SENLHLFLAIDKPSSQRPLSLISDDKHVRARLPKVGSQMMKNAATVAHTRASHDQTRAPHLIDCARFVGSWRRFHRLQIIAQRTFADERFHLVIEKFHVLHVNVRCLKSHWTVEENRKRLYFAGAKHFAEQ